MKNTSHKIINTRIIIIDDNEMVRDDFKKILFNEKTQTKEMDEQELILFGDIGSDISKQDLNADCFDVSFASQGKEGFEKICEARNEGRPYALAFVDVRMPPGWDGVETVKHIWEQVPDIEIVFCTAFSDYSLIDMNKALGAKPFFLLKKPYEIIEVLQFSSSLCKKWYHAMHDELTDLPNRHLFLDRLSQSIALSERHQQQFSLLFIDIDGFKEINDCLGHHAGDELLKIIADRLNKRIRKADTLARLGGDEFVIILTNIKTRKEVDQICQDILYTLSQPIPLKDEVRFVTASIGVSIFPIDANNSEDLMKHADMAMYNIKENGKGAFMIFEKHLNELLEKKHKLLLGIRQAIQNNEFEIYYQPQYDISTLKIIGAEALIRWANPNYKLVSPDNFIKLAEENGLIEHIGNIVFDKVINSYTTIKNYVDMNFRIAVNVSPKQFFNTNLIQKLESYPSIHFLDIEITENVFINNLEKTKEQLEKLQALGLRISLDDFGTGYSCLSYLKELPIEALKIDKSFISHNSENIKEIEIVKAIISMAHHLNIRVIAEGVETKAQLQELVDINCNSAQGFLLSKPLSLNEFLNHVRLKV